MNSKHIQAPTAVVMIRPHRFHPNPETASDNAFQRTDGQLSPKEIARVAYTARSNRADPIPLERFSTHFNFEPMAFDSANEHGG